MFDFPAIYKEANEISIGTQRTYLALLKIFLSLLLISALIFTYFSDVWEIKLANAIISIAIVVFSFIFSFVNFQGVWYSARAVAESIKTVSWRYAMRTEPYNIDDHDAKALFLKTLKQIVNMNHDFAKHMGAKFSAQSQVPDSLSKVRGDQLLVRRDLYHTHRVTEQLNWYIRKSNYNRNMSFIFLVILVVASILLSVFLFLDLRPEFKALVFPVEILLSILSIVFTWIQTKKYRELENSYALTSHEIGFIATIADEIDTEGKLSEYVMSSENAFSREHTQWIARKDS